MKEPLTIIISENELRLEERCWCVEEIKCISTPDDNCEVCNGTGLIISSMGKTIINLVKKYGI